MIKAIVTDIEGTTSSLSFVKDILFPYAREHLAEFVTRYCTLPEVKAALVDVEQIVGRSLSLEAAIEQLIDWSDQDQKLTPLKTIQGLIWYAGYHQGHFTGHLYSDAVAGLKHWHEQGLKLYVYSSGSVNAQKLLFSHTEWGDLTPLFSGFFDTRVGAKRDASAYQAIAEQINLPAADILFLSDIKEELDAAKSAGFATYWLKREGKLDSEPAHKQVLDFAAIVLDGC